MPKEKTLGELAQEFPDKTYKELEKYRDADRHEEAAQIPLTESQKKQEDLEPIEGEEQDNPTLWEIATTHKVSYADAVPIQENMRLKRDALKAACIIGEMKRHRTPLEKMKKRAEEAEGETTIVKGIGLNSPEMKALQARVKELDNSLAIDLELNDSHQRYNGKLQTTVTEVEEDNNKLAKQVEDLENNRKFGEGKH